MVGFGTATADSSPIYGRSFTSASPVWWDAADGGSPISPAFQHPASWDRCMTSTKRQQDGVR
ncbi:hypothetical protein BDA96_05G237700 [Sorghum bicolor]|uniref:Uncharacterized protein n=1 Tax=Sorghum bicolor TaxID=4558 RepID=A0A921QZ52_SORBI|nr:hypothetical protein BDA96_07G089800 [Sorghum bicolor]KAG0531014.1 hypothetical protein BDA96_05G237700 [Sorghum bicolor]